MHGTLRRTRGLLVLATFAVSACEKAPTADVPTAVAIDTAAILAEIDSLGARVMKANQTADAALYTTTWAVDGIMSEPGSPPIVGRDSIVAHFRRRPPLPPGAAMTIHVTEVKVLGSEWAYVMGIDSLKLSPPVANPPAVKTYTFMVLLKKGAEGWQSYREVLSPHQSGGE